MSNSATLTFGYTNTDFTRKYTFRDLTEDALTGLKAKVKALNASIASDDGLSNFFRSDDFDDSDSDNIVGKFAGIVAAQYESSNITNIDLN